MDPSPFPTQATNTYDDKLATIPWWVAEIAVDQHKKENGHHGQDVADFARRHGFGVGELALLLGKRVKALEEALQSVGNDHYTSPSAWPDHIRKLAYRE